MTDLISPRLGSLRGKHLTVEGVLFEPCLAPSSLHSPLSRLAYLLLVPVIANSSVLQASLGQGCPRTAKCVEDSEC